MKLWRVFALLACLGQAAPIEAAAPRSSWRTLVTEHFRIHYHEGLKDLAHAVAGVAEPAYDEVGLLFDHRASVPIHLVLTDETDSPNGFAESVPQSVVTLFFAVPDPFSTLGDYEDFMRLLVIHELVHIIHLDTVHGIPRWVNKILGKTWIPNAVQPSWFIEGVAVWAETRLTAGGRNRNLYVDAWVRALVMDDRFPDLGVLSHYTRRHPGGGYPWYMGGRFVAFIAERHGDEVIACMSHAYGGRMIPYAVNLVAEQCTGETFVELWEHWRAHETRRAQIILQNVEASGVKEGGPGWSDSTQLTNPRWSQDGRLLAFVDAPRDADRRLVIRSEQSELLTIRTNDGEGAFSADGSHYLAVVRDTYDLVFSYRDLELIEVATGLRRRRTRGERLRSPDVSLDNVVVAQQQAAGKSWLVSFSLFGDDAPKPWGALEPGEQVYHPRWSPDGRHVVAVVADPVSGARRLELFAKHSGSRRVLACADERCMHPCFSADGKWVVYSSDAEGVFDVWRVRVSTGEIERLSRVRTAAYFAAPRPKSDELQYVLATSEGWSLRTLNASVAVQRADVLDAHPGLQTDDIIVQPAPHRWPWASQASAGSETLEVRTASVSPRSLPEPRPRSVTHATLQTTQVGIVDEPYRAWESLLPQTWLPTMGEDGVGTTLGLSLAGADAVRIHRWTLGVWGGLSTKRLGYSIGYSNRAFKLPWSLSSSLRHQTRFLNFSPTVASEDRLETSFRLAASFSVPLSRWELGNSLFFSWNFEDRRGRNLTTIDPFGDPPFRRGDIRLSSLGIAWSLGSTRGFAESLGAAQGATLDMSLRWFEPLLGSDTRLISIEARGRAYWSMPWAQHHVLALKGAMGTSVGQLNRRSVYALGGLPVRNVFTDIIDQATIGGDTLRGYEVARFRGDSFWVSTLEYRLPLLTFEQGLHTVPVFVDRLWAAAFMDVGDTPQGELRFEQSKVGVGAELRLAFSFAYVARYLMRLGYARGLRDGGIHNVYLVLGGLF